MVQVPAFRIDKFPDVDKSLGPEAAFAYRFGARRMKSTGEAIYYQGPEGGACPALDAGFCHCEARLCGAWQRQLYRERSMDLSR